MVKCLVEIRRFFFKGERKKRLLVVWGWRVLIEVFVIGGVSFWRRKMYDRVVYLRSIFRVVSSVGFRGFGGKFGFLLVERV